MANWVNFVKAERFPAIRNRYRRAAQFLAAVRAEAAGSAVWARFRPASTVSQGRANWQVDVDAVPLVRPMRSGGALKS